MRSATIVAATGTSSDDEALRWRQYQEGQGLAWSRRCRALARPGRRASGAAAPAEVVVTKVEWCGLRQTSANFCNNKSAQQRNSATMLDIKNDATAREVPRFPTHTRNPTREEKRPGVTHTYTTATPCESCFGSDAYECPDDRTPRHSARHTAGPNRGHGGTRDPRRPKRFVVVTQGRTGHPAAWSRRRTPTYKFTCQIYEYETTYT